MTRRFLPETSSARRCCRSAGVSVQREESFLEVLADAVPRENWRAFSFVVSRSVDIDEGWKMNKIGGDALERRPVDVGGTSIHSSR